MAVCVLYYLIWIYVLPHFGKYKIRQELIVLDDESAKVHRLVKIPLTELGIWDAEHNLLGQRVSRVYGSGTHRNDDNYTGNFDEKKETWIRSNP